MATVWAPVPNSEKYGVAIYNYAPTHPNHLALDVGQPVAIVEKCGQWYFGSYYDDGSKTGVFPATYVQIKESIVSVKNNGWADIETVVSKEDPVVREAVDALQLWGQHLPKLFMSKQLENYASLKKSMLELISWRRQLLSGTLPQDQIRDIKLRIAARIDSGNRRLSLDVVPRYVSGELVEAGDVNLVELYHMHKKTMETVLAQNDVPWSFASGTASSASLSNISANSLGSSIPSSAAAGLASQPGMSGSPGGSSPNLFARDQSSSTLLSSNSASSMPGGSQSPLSSAGSPLQQAPGAAPAANQRRNQANAHHLLFEMKNFVCPVGEETEVFFSLYNAAESRFITEEFLTRLNKSGMPNDLKLINNIRTVFIDLSNKDIEAQIFLVCRIVRSGKMLMDDKDKKDDKKGANKVRRPYGSAVMDISDIINRKTTDDDNKEYTLTVYQTSELDFPQLHEFLIRRSGKVEPVPRAKGIYVTLKLLSGDLVQVKKEHALLFKDANQLTKKLGFPDIILPGDYRNDLYVTFVQSEVQQGRKTAPKNVEVALSVHLDTGELLHNCISLGSGDTLTNDEFQSVVYYHWNSPRWNETIRLDVPIDKFYRSHLKLLFRHMSSGEIKDKNEKNFSFTWLPLASANGTTINDGTHTLDLYRYDKKVDEPKIYLKEDATAGSSSSSPAANDPSGLSKSPKETIALRTLLCSTKLTQNVDLLALLKWRDRPQELDTIIKRMTYVSGDEIVKFLQDIFDALFSILDFNTELYGQLIFDTLCFIIGILADKKYSNFHAVLDIYIQKHFSGAMAHKTLLLCLSNYISKADDVSMGKQVRAAMKALEYIVRFLIQSRLLYSRAHQGKGNAEFTKELRFVLDSFAAMMRKKSPESIIGTQTTALQYFPSVFPDLTKVFVMADLCSIVASFVESVPLDKSKSILVTHKLQFLVQVVQGPLFQAVEGRTLLVPTILKHLQYHLEAREEMHLCLELVSSVLKVVGVNASDEDVLGCLQLLRPILSTCSKTPANDGTAGEVVACLLSILQLMQPSHFKEFSSRLNDVDLADFLNELFGVFLIFVTANVYPRDWTVISLEQNFVVYNVIEYLASDALVSRFLDGPKFKKQLWNDFFRLCLAFTTQESLQLENMRSSRRDKIMSKYNDMRLQVALIMEDLWTRLASLQLHFVPALVGPLLETTLVPEPELRIKTIGMLGDMISTEFSQKGTIQSSTAEAIDRLDVLVSEGKGDENYIQVFQSILQDKFAGNHQLSKLGNEFISTVNTLLTLLLQYRALGNDDEKKDERASVMLELLHFFKKIKRDENYYRYVDRLRDVHVQNGNYIEAGFALKQFAQHLSWDDSKKLPAQPNGKYPAQTMFERKAMVFNEIIEYFDTGKAWELAIEHCKELALQYETELFDYIKMGEILHREAKFFEKIVTQPRYYSEFFRVGYYGKGFPSTIRNAVYIYRGDELERIAAFVERIQSQYPEAQMIKNNAPPDDKIINADGQHIQIVKVDPVAVPKDFKKRKVPEGIERYYALNNINTFTFSRPFRKGAKTGNEFADLWTERTTLVTDTSLPNILRRALVVETTRVEISPIENAMEAMVSKNKELVAMIEKYEVSTGSNASPFTMALNGVIDAAVNGGTEMYKKAFFSKTYLSTYPEHAEFVKTLKVSLDDQISILQRGLTLHGRIVSEEMKALHSKMETFFADLKEKHSRPLDDNGVALPASSNPSSPPEQRKPTPMARTESVRAAPNSAPVSSDSEVTQARAPLSPSRSMEETDSSGGAKPLKPVKPLPGSKPVFPPKLN